jgi:hypothetical protein
MTPLTEADLRIFSNLSSSSSSSVIVPSMRTLAIWFVDVAAKSSPSIHAEATATPSAAIPSAAMRQKVSLRRRRRRSIRSSARMAMEFLLFRRKPKRFRASL